MPGMADEWWKKMRSAPSDPGRVYASEYHFIPNPDGDAGTVKRYGPKGSEDHGVTFTAMSQDGLMT